MGLLQAKPATYQDLLAVPENVVGEIINGRLVTHPRPAPRHAHAYSSLGFELGGPFDHARNGPGGWWILDEPELHLGDHILVPDIAGWRREHLPIVLAVFEENAVVSQPPFDAINFELGSLWAD